MRSLTVRNGVLSAGVLVALGVPAAMAHGQAPRAPSTPFVWVTAGGGASNRGLGGVLGLDIQFQHHLISVRGSGAAEILGGDLWDVGLLYGRVHRTARGMGAISAGIARMGGSSCPSLLGGCTLLGARWSIPLAARWSWQALPFFGVGLYGYASINPEQSFSGVLLTLELGHIR